MSDVWTFAQDFSSDEIMDMKKPSSAAGFRSSTRGHNISNKTNLTIALGIHMRPRPVPRRWPRATALPPIPPVHTLPVSPPPPRPPSRRLQPLPRRSSPMRPHRRLASGCRLPREVLSRRKAHHTMQDVCWRCCGLDMP